MNGAEPIGDCAGSFEAHTHTQMHIFHALLLFEMPLQQVGVFL